VNSYPLKNPIGKLSLQERAGQGSLRFIFCLLLVLQGRSALAMTQYGHALLFEQLCNSDR
jgi:hypothetical protein